MFHEIKPVLTISEPFESNLGGDAYILQAFPTDTADQGNALLPVYFHGGYGVQNAKYLQYIATNHGRPAFTVAYDKKRLKDVYYTVIDDEANAEPELIHRKELRRLFPMRLGSVVAQSQVNLGADILLAAQQCGYDKIDVIGQSAGALRALTAASQAPSQIKSLVLAYPAGATHPNIRRIGQNATRYASSWFSGDVLTGDGLIPKTVNWDSGSGTATLMHEPKNIAADGENVLFSSHSLMLHKLRQCNEAPSVMMVAGEFDSIFLADRLLEGLVSANDIDRLMVLRGLHAIGKRRSALDTIMRLVTASGTQANPPDSHDQPGILKSLPDRIMADDGVSRQYIDQLCITAEKCNVV